MLFWIQPPSHVWKAVRVVYFTRASRFAEHRMADTLDKYTEFAEKAVSKDSFIEASIKQCRGSFNLVMGYIQEAGLHTTARAVTWAVIGMAHG